MPTGICRSASCLQDHCPNCLYFYDNSGLMTRRLHSVILSWNVTYKQSVPNLCNFSLEVNDSYTFWSQSTYRQLPRGGRSSSNPWPSNSKAPYTLPVKLSDFTVWRHTWLKNWVNCAVLTGNNASLRTVLSSRLSHRELRSSLRESHSFLSLPADNTMT